MAWKTAKSWKWDKMENQMENGLQLDRGKNGETMGNSLENLFLGLLPLSSWGLFSILVFHVFPHLRLLAVFHAMPARDVPNPRRIGSFSGAGTKNSNAAKTHKIHTSGVCLQVDRNSGTKIGQ